MEKWTERKEPEYVRSGLPYIIHPDYERLVKLCHIWQKSTKQHSRNSQRMIAAQCEGLYYRVYGSVCYFDNVPKNDLPDKYW